MNFKGNMGIACISDMEPQPLLIQSHLGSYAITTVGKIANQEDLIREAYEKGHIHFLEMSSGKINATELVARLSIRPSRSWTAFLLAQEKIIGSMTILLLTPEGIYISRDRKGRTPAVIGRKEGLSVSLSKVLLTLILALLITVNWRVKEIVLMKPEG